METWREDNLARALSGVGNQTLSDLFPGDLLGKAQAIIEQKRGLGSGSIPDPLEEALQTVYLLNSSILDPGESDPTGKDIPRFKAIIDAYKPETMSFPNGFDLETGTCLLEED